MDLVDELAQRVECLVARVRPYPLQSLDLVEHDEESGVTTVAEDGKQPLQEVQRLEMVEVALHSSEAPHRGGHVRLATDPCGQTFRRCMIGSSVGGPVRPQRRGESRRAPRDVGQPPLQQLAHGTVEPVSVVFADLADAEHVLFEREDPAVQDRPECARRELLGS